MIKKNTKIIIVNFPHNPTGYVPLINEWLELIETCKKNNIYLFSDEMYCNLFFQKQRTIPSVSVLYSKG